MTTTTSMEEHGGANSSHEEIIKEEKDNINRRKMVELSSPTTSFNDEISKKGGWNLTKDDKDENLTPSTTDLNDKDDELESTKAEIGEVMEENERLKQHLNQAMKDYQLLQSKFHEISQQKIKQSSDNQMTTLPPQACGDDDDDLVSLSLGRSSSLDSKKGNIKSSIKTTNDQVSTRSKSSNNDDEEAKERNLDLGLECKFEASSTRLDHPKIAMPNSSPNHSFNETKDGNEVLKTGVNVTNGTRSSGGDDEAVHQPPVKKARVSVRVRCDGPTMNDGCQWRKYGQKIAKGNPCPRAYYRCTVAPSCPVRKQVQRCAEDMSILITTYEGAHNHPLPVSATAMASTTSAAAYMLMSKSSSSLNNPGSHPSTTTTTTPIGAELHSDHLKFNILENSKPKPFYLPNSSTLFSPNITTPAHPTVTLDLTSSSNLSSTSQFNRVTPNVGQRYTSTNNLNFNFSDNNSTNNPSLNSWPNGPPSYGAHQSYMNKITQDNPLNNIIGPPSNNNAYNYQPNNLFQRSNIPHNRPLNHDSLPDTIAQAAKALTSDPSFQSILTATLSSFMSGHTNGNNASDRAIAGEGNKVMSTTSFVENMKWGALHTSLAGSTFESTSMEANGHGSSLLSKASNSEPTRNHMFLSPSLPLTSSNKRKSNSPDQNDHSTQHN